MAEEDDSYALSLSGVAKRFKAGKRTVEALRSVDLKVRRGAVTGLIGPDGAGKTTLMRLAAGLLRADSGRVTVLGLDADHEALQIQASIGYMPQRFGLYEDLTVQENLDLYADLQGVPRTERAPRYEELMHMTGLGPFTGRLAGRLSGGMKQKLGLACTLVHPPRLLLLDEPTVGVDPVSRRELWAIVYRLVKDEQMTVLLSTAYLDEAERCAEVILMHKGQVLSHGAPDDFSRGLKGRTFAVEVPPGSTKRSLQTRLAETEGVIDAVIQKEHVRLVLATGIDPDGFEPLAGLDYHPVEPRFEDHFITALTGAEPAAAGDDGAEPLPTPQRASDEAVIKVAGLDRRFGDFYAVRDISFEVRRGEVFGLLGANGAGKSTTFRMLCGLLPASGGELEVAGVNLRRAPAQARQRIGYMSQKFSLYGALSVAQNLEFFSIAYGLRGRRRGQRIAWALQAFELGPNRQTTSRDLSLGYKQRLALACALMHEPDILFLDEPTSGVDPLARREFWRRIDALAEAGVTVLVTTHFMEEAEYCDRLAIMAAGEILSLGTPSEVKATARTEQQPDPSMQDAFIALIEAHDAPARDVA
jgi:ABC-2 type transport system ATP-binding protein